MITSTDICLAAARQGLVLRPSLAKEALRAQDREARMAAERRRWSVIPWDGTGDPPVGTRDRWVHDHDAIGRATQEAFQQGKVVYFLMHDGTLHHYQPYVAYERGRIPLEADDQRPYHWQKAADAHIAREADQVVDGQILQDALTVALDLHEQRGIPVGLAARADGAPS